jgi:hypothetical protein
MIKNIYDFLKLKQITFVHVAELNNVYLDSFLLTDKFLFQESIDDLDIILKLEDICSVFQKLYPSLSVVFDFSRYDTYSEYVN